ncbi:hypothetical protein H8K38_02370 [Undibacterium sp. FT79W]|uniref:hypothetical protein n=1 Tax=Undibacterium sp. FT79W TaxID=2762296 RepID=UPI00164B4AE0|nr:hypothetical protein [Undibacterium sp. FT79W]MBC3876646.1 hypothetical protein [Undibacterium sp. FT79W]
MSRLAFAKLPSAWAKSRPEWVYADDGEQAPAGYIEVPTAFHEGRRAFAKGSMAQLQWRYCKGGGTAALLILFALAIISNRRQKQDGLRENETVLATYEDIQDLLPISRALLAKGLRHLLDLGAITVTRTGRNSLYTLTGIEVNGKWCMLPQQHLFNKHSYLQRLKFFVDQIKRPSSLHAVKLYMLLLAFRTNGDNIARISYDNIGEYSGMRREDISTAIQALVAAQLVRLDKDEEKARGERMHNRYYILGLVSD